MRIISSWVFSSIVAATAVASLPAAATPPAPTIGQPGVQPAVIAGAFAQRFGADAKVMWNASRTAPKRISGIAVATSGSTPTERATSFVRANAGLLGLEGDVKVEDVQVFTPPDPAARGRGSFDTVRMSQLWNGLPVEGRSIVVRLDGAGRVTSLSSDLGPLVVPTPTAIVTPASVVANIKATYQIVAISEPQKVVLALGTAGRITWKVAVAVVPLQANFFVWVDAESGRVLKEAPAAFDQNMVELPVRQGEVDGVTP